MAINKFQITLISLINALSAIYSWICVSEYGIIYKSFTTNASQIWLSTIFMGIVAALTAVYFCLMCLYSTACTCLTGDESNQKPSFSVCGCFSILLAMGSYFWGWILFLTVSNEASQVIMDNYPLIWNAFCVLLFNPVATVGMVLLFFIYRSCCKNKKKRSSYRQSIDDESDVDYNDFRNV